MKKCYSSKTELIWSVSKLVWFSMINIMTNNFPNFGEFEVQKIWVSLSRNYCGSIFLQTDSIFQYFMCAIGMYVHPYRVKKVLLFNMYVKDVWLVSYWIPCGEKIESPVEIFQCHISFHQYFFCSDTHRPTLSKEVFLITSLQKALRWGFYVGQICFLAFSRVFTWSENVM